MNHAVEQVSDSPRPPPPKTGRKYVGNVLFVFLIVVAAVLGTAAGLLLVFSTDLPQVTELERYRPSTITELYDDQNRVIGQFALQRRVIDKYDDFPKVLRDALVSTEDKDFESHWGVDVWRVFGAAYRDIAAGGRAQGASTLTMQLSRNLFLSPDRNFRRKIQEVMLVHPDRTPLHQAADFHALRQPDLSRHTACTALRPARTTTSARRRRT